MIAIRQICGGFRQWSRRYMGKCSGQRVHQHQVMTTEKGSNKGLLYKGQSTLLDHQSEKWQMRDFRKVINFDQNLRKYVLKLVSISKIATQGYWITLQINFADIYSHNKAQKTTFSSEF